MFNEITLHNYSRPLSERAKSRKFVGPYKWRPAKPMGKRGFYMQHDTKYLQCAGHGAGFDLRIEEAGPAWRHDLGLDLFQPIIARLPHGRGFLAGWTFGPGMCASIDSYIWEDIDDAKRAAQSEAEEACEREAEEYENRDEWEED